MTEKRERSKFSGAILNLAQARNTAKAPTSAPANPAPSPRRGRPAGKRSSEATVQVTAYIDAGTHYYVKMQLLKNAQSRKEKLDFSELVQSLLAAWLKGQL